MTECYDCGKDGASNPKTMKNEGERFEKQFAKEVTVIVCDECKSN